MTQQERKIEELRESLTRVLMDSLDGAGPMTHAVVTTLISKRAMVLEAIRKAA